MTPYPADPSLLKNPKRSLACEYNHLIWLAFYLFIFFFLLVQTNRASEFHLAWMRWNNQAQLVEMAKFLIFSLSSWFRLIRQMYF